MLLDRAWLIASLFDGFLLLVGVAALWRGDRPEKIGALVVLTAAAGSSALRLAGLASWRAGGPTAAIDVAAAATFFWLGCRTTRFWPVWGFGLLLAILSVDAIKLALPRVTLLAFASGQSVYAYLVVLTVALGTLRAARSPRDPHNGFRPPCPTPLPPMPGS